MAIRKNKDDSWIVDISNGINAVTLKQRRIVRKGFKTKREALEAERYLRSVELKEKSFSTKITIDMLYQLLKEEDEINTTINKIITIEITPPCDFSNSKKQERSRIIQGFMLDYNEKIKDKFKAERFYKICPLSIENYDEPQMIVLDFYKFQTITEKQLSKKDVYEIAMKAKNNLFADILQKLSSHMSRLGLAILEP